MNEGQTLPAATLMRISDEAVNRARTPEYVLATIDQIIRFIELPDLVALPPKPGQTVEVSYEGLPRTPKVKVSFK
jgi:hypothetical protein